MKTILDQQRFDQFANWAGHAVVMRRRHRAIASWRALPQEARADRDRTEQFASNLLALNSQFTRSVLVLLVNSAALPHTQHSVPPCLLPVETACLPHSGLFHALASCSWVNTQKASNPQKFWIEGVRDYVRHATKLLDEFGDLATGDGVAALKSAAAGA